MTWKAQLTIAGLVLSGGYGLMIAVVNLIGSGGRDEPFQMQPWGNILLLVAGAMWLAWLPAVRERLRDNGIRLRWNGFWAFAGWIFPVVSLVVPLLVMSEIDRVGRRRHSTPFLLWSILWTAYQVVALIEIYLWRNDHLLVTLVGGLQAVAAAAAVWLVVRITATLPAAVRPLRPAGTAH